MQRQHTVGWVGSFLAVAPLAMFGCGTSASDVVEDEASTSASSERLTAVDRVLNDVERKRMTDWLDKNKVPDGKIQKHLRTLGDRVVNCVAIADQPSVQRLNIETIEQPPVSDYVEAADAPQIARPVALRSEGGNPTNCDPGTVPIPQLDATDLARFRTLEDFFRKEPQGAHWQEPSKNESPIEPPHDGPTNQHQYAVFSRTVTNWGSLGVFNVWKPATELSDEFSLVQTWVQGGTGSQIQTLEAGWQVFGDLYGDLYPHLFIYSTQDDYISTGCYNSTCADFVQVSSSIFPGQGLSPYSTPGTGNQWQTDIRWQKTGDSGSWWLQVQGQWVGYYPRSLYASTGVANHASKFLFGGEIVNVENMGLHTTTDMGSGAFPSGGFGSAAYLKQLGYYWSVGTSVLSTEATSMTAQSITDSQCYDMTYASGDPNWGSYGFVGGAGYNFTNCR